MPRYLHITNGDSVKGTLVKSVPGKVTAIRESLIEGPIPQGLPAEAWRQVRAHYYASRGWGDVAKNLKSLEEFDRVFETAGDFDEVVLWFEHDLFDQLQLIYILDRLSREVRPKKLSLICIDQFPGVERFHGLGVLNATQLGSLWGTQKPVSPNQMDLAQRAWKAFGSPDPMDIERFLEGPSSDLPFLACALKRHLAEFPSTDNGLSRTETIALDQLAQEPASPAHLFVAMMQDIEPHPYMGDSSYFNLIEALAAGPQPLIEVADPGDEKPQFAVRKHRLTPLGQVVLRGDADRVRELGIDLHFGGAHLRGHEVPWRWSPELGRLIASY